ncbi:MAG: GNAT family N-acetyltransferase [Thiotrichales bacterium]|nr:MAG: GNAT family N-acetyltransferase [Thiotrichales bacterium]
MVCTIHRITSDSDITAVAELADEIWHEHFIPIIGDQQVDYMLEKFQSPAAIAEQLQSGFEYYIAAIDKRYVGYMGLVPDPPNGTMMISKIYVKREARGDGIGKRLLQLVETECNQRRIDTIWLTVNRFNHAPIEWYRRKGFFVVDEVKKDIGGGFYMDDFIMRKRLC